MSAQLERTKEQIEIDNRILRELAECPLDRPGLVERTQYSHEQVASSLFRLRSMRYFSVSDAVNSSRYVLTKEGRAAAPPKYVRDLSKFFESKDKGAKHIVGLSGKFDYSQPLRGGFAMIYEALIRPMTQAELADAANMEQKAISVYLKKLIKLEIIEETDSGKAGRGKVYARKRPMTVQEAEPPKPLLTPAAPGDPVIDKIVSDNAPTYQISNFSKPNPTLDDAMDELLGKFAPFEVMLCCMARLETSYLGLEKFRNDIMQSLPKT